MTADTLEDQLTKYLTDLHSIEQQALAQMRAAPKLAGHPTLSEAFTRHLAETEEHEGLVRDRLEARGASPATVKDLVGTLTGKGFVAFAASQPDTPGKLVVRHSSRGGSWPTSRPPLRRFSRCSPGRSTPQCATSASPPDNPRARQMSASSTCRMSCPPPVRR